MANQRPERTRRAVVRAAGLSGLVGVAGCTSGTFSARRTGNESASVAILAAGSLQRALQDGLESAVDVPIRVETHGSATVARMIAEGQRDPDIVSVADTALFERPLSPPWYSVFASNAVVVAYNPDTDGGRRLAEASEDRWYEPLVSGEGRLGRTDPDQDPLGYRTLFTLELASRYYDSAPDLREAVLDREQIYPETALISQFETGSIDAAFAYRNMAVERGYEYVDLPDRIDLSNPAHTREWYSTVSYTLPSGQEIRGDLVSYGSTVRHTSDAALAVFDAHTTGDYLDDAGFLRREGFPRYEGSVPDGVREATDRSNERRSVRGPERPTLANAVSGVTLLV